MEANTTTDKILRKEKQRKITGQIQLLSGMRIGGSDTLLEIGGVDAGQTCIKHPVTYKPYIPGSSLKGKMRSEMEKKLGRFRRFTRDGKEVYEPCDCAQCMVCRAFGPHKVVEHNLGPTRLLVRDCPVIKGGEFEIKSSTAINRKTNAALGGSLRTEERVVEGSEFDFRLDLQIWSNDGECRYGDWRGEQALIEFVKDCLRLVEQTGIGAGTSKGSGQIRFINLNLDGEDFDL
ncbi:MAG TPA: type III-A CRISPR-associated RAMP protein Csm3 [Blastocatellia bacterium]|nr:type III-A CRISPR-associated RAMP protein Csm3 [Blastocatellia bacterium]